MVCITTISLCFLFTYTIVMVYRVVVFIAIILLCFWFTLALYFVDCVFVTKDSNTMCMHTWSY